MPRRPPGLPTTIVVIVGVLAAWVLIYGFALSGLQEHRSQAVLYSHFREALAAETAPIGNAPIATGAPVALLSAPVIGMRNLVVVQGTSSATMRVGPGHRRDTVLPGQAGVSVLYGRSATFGAPFGEIGRFEPGDLLAVTTGEGQFNYKVLGVRRPGDAGPTTLAAGESRLVLETSSATSWRTGFAPGHTLFVDATLIGAAAPAGQVSSLGSGERAMDGDSGGLTALVLWLEGLLLAAVGLVWCAARWGRWPSWLVGAPVLTFLLWGTTASAAVLLPNLL